MTLDRPDLARRLTVVPQPRRIPAVLSVEEVTLLLRAASSPKYKAAFATAYGAGLRVSEVVALKVGDVDSERMLLRVERGKGRKAVPSANRWFIFSPTYFGRALSCSASCATILFDLRAGACPGHGLDPPSCRDPCRRCGGLLTLDGR